MSGQIYVRAFETAFFDAIVHVLLSKDPSRGGVARIGRDDFRYELEHDWPGHPLSVTVYGGPIESLERAAGSDRWPLFGEVYVDGPDGS